MEKIITINELGHTTLSDLIESVIYDIDRCIEHGIALDMARFFTRNDVECSACLGGMSVLGFIPSMYLEWRYFPPNAEYALKLAAAGNRKGLDTMMRFFDALRCKSRPQYTPLSEICNLGPLKQDTVWEIIYLWEELNPIGYYG